MQDIGYCCSTRSDSTYKLPVIEKRRTVTKNPENQHSHIRNQPNAKFVIEPPLSPFSRRFPFFTVPLCKYSKKGFCQCVPYD